MEGSSNDSSNVRMIGNFSAPIQTTYELRRQQRILETQQQIATWKKGLRFEVVWLLSLNMILIGAIIFDKGSQCPNSHLLIWMSVQIFVQFLLIIPNILLQLNLPSFFQQVQEKKMEPIGLFYACSRVLNLFWIIWAVFGLVWTFQANHCAQTTPAIYAVCMFFAVMHMIAVGLPLVICCVSIPGGFLAYRCFPRYFGVDGTYKASPKLINKTTRTEKFGDELGMCPEDACCAICLCEYDQGEELRFLNCGHHFHGECIYGWLLKNRTCPFCKRDIETKDQKKGEEEKPLRTIQS